MKNFLRLVWISLSLLALWFIVSVFYGSHSIIKPSGNYNPELLTRPVSRRLVGARLRIYSRENRNLMNVEDLLSDIGPPESDGVVLQIIDLWEKASGEEAVRKQFSSLYRDEKQVSSILASCEVGESWGLTCFDYVRGSKSGLVRMKIDNNTSIGRIVSRKDLPKIIRDTILPDD